MIPIISALAIVMSLALPAAQAAITEDGTGSSPIVVTQSGGDCVITGTSGDDELVVGDYYGLVFIYDVNTGNPSNEWYAEWEISDCTSITVDLGEGDDVLWADYWGYEMNVTVLPMTVYGGDGDDTLAGGLADDFIDGGDGADVINSHAGDDTLKGGPGDDTIDGGDDDDIIEGNRGDDVLDGGDGDDTLLGGLGVDSLSGGGGNDTLSGGQKADYIEGGEGDDTIYGHTASSCGTWEDTIVDDEGSNTIYAYPSACP